MSTRQPPPPVDDEALARARAYDAWFDRGWGGYAASVERAALLDALGDIEGQRVLDIGCGTGRFTAALERAGVHATGLDADAAALHIAATRLDGPLVHADAHALPFPDQAFDLAVTLTATEFLTDPTAALDEAVRVTRPAGRLLVAALNPASPWGLAHRQRLRHPPWDQACLHTPAELDALTTHRGHVEAHAALYTPTALPGLRILGPALERLGRLVPRWAAFQIRVIDLPTSEEAP